MKTTLLFFLAFISLSNLGWSQVLIIEEYQEEVRSQKLNTTEYADEVSRMSVGEKWEALSENFTIANTMCLLAAENSMTSFALGSSAWGGYIPKWILEKKITMNYRNEVSRALTIGGGFVLGFNTLTYVFSGFDSKEYNDLRISFAATAKVIKKSFGPTSYCYKSAQKMEILLSQQP